MSSLRFLGTGWNSQHHTPESYQNFISDKLKAEHQQKFQIFKLQVSRLVLSGPNITLADTYIKPEVPLHSSNTILLWSARGSLHDVTGDCGDSF